MYRGDSGPPFRKTYQIRRDPDGRRNREHRWDAVTDDGHESAGARTHRQVTVDSGRSRRDDVRQRDPDDHRSSKHDDGRDHDTPEVPLTSDDPRQMKTKSSESW